MYALKALRIAREKNKRRSLRYIYRGERYRVHDLMKVLSPEQWLGQLQI